MHCLHSEDMSNERARGVAVGSSIGHAIGGFFGGGSSQPAEQQAADNGAVSSQNQQAGQNSWGGNCDVDAKQFTKCLDEVRTELSTIFILFWLASGSVECVSEA